MPITTTLITQALSYILPHIRTHRSKFPETPFILGLTGLQGSGKSTWTEKLHEVLTTQHNYKVISLSLDDFYLPHEGLVELRESNPENSLFRTRGVPGTHDEVLAREFFESLRGGGGKGEEEEEEVEVKGEVKGEAKGEGEDGEEEMGEIKVPAFDKSKFNGEGDRVPQSEWEKVSRDPTVDVVIFEGWCVGFTSIDTSSDLEKAWKSAVARQQTSLTTTSSSSPSDDPSFSTTCLANHSFTSIFQINSNLLRYNETFMGPSNFNYLIHLDTADLKNVYRWRIGQEHALLKEKGEGMSDEAVVKFVQGYMPCYELYLGRLREGFFKEEVKAEKKRQLRILMARDRRVEGMEEV